MGSLSRAATLAAALLLAACAAKPPVSEEEGTVAAGYGRVFGRVQYTYNGEPTPLGLAFMGSHTVVLFLRELPSGEMHYMSVDAEGDFSWPLKPGKYVVIGYTAGRQAGSYREQVTRRLMAPIEVAAPGAALYIGDLRVQSDHGRYRTDWVDAYDATLKRAGEKLSAAKFQPMKALLRPEPAPGKFSFVRPICGPYWGVTCSENHQGLEAMQPDQSGQSFPVADSLTPLLEWKPATRPGVTYDVAIYESINFEYGGGTAKVSRMLGAQAAYAEALSETKYRPAVALAPGRKYEWSVRVREGDTVSAWSTNSYSLFLVIAGRRASGQYFSLETPAK